MSDFCVLCPVLRACGAVPSLFLTGSQTEPSKLTVPILFVMPTDEYERRHVILKSTRSLMNRERRSFPVSHVFSFP